MIKVNTPSVFTLVSNLITVEAALETVSEKEGNQSFLDLKVAFYYSRLSEFCDTVFIAYMVNRQVDKYLASGDAFVSRLSTQERQKLLKTASDCFIEKHEELAKCKIKQAKGNSLWKKWKRLRGAMQNEDIPLWNALVQKNSGINIDEMLLLFRQKKYLEAASAKQNKNRVIQDDDEAVGDEDYVNEAVGDVNDDGNVDAASVDQDDREDKSPDSTALTEPSASNLMTKREIEKCQLLKNFPPDYMHQTYLAFIKLGPPAAPFDSPVLRGELSCGPKKKLGTLSSDSLMIKACDLSKPADRSTPLSRADARNQHRMEEEFAIEKRRTKKFLVAQQESNKLESYVIDLECYRQKIEDFEKKIALHEALGDKDSANRIR